jgi:hypothetical protein
MSPAFFCPFIAPRSVARETGLHSDTITLITTGTTVKPITLQCAITIAEEKSGVCLPRTCKVISADSWLSADQRIP